MRQALRFIGGIGRHCPRGEKQLRVITSRKGPRRGPYGVRVRDRGRVRVRVKVRFRVRIRAKIRVRVGVQVRFNSPSVRRMSRWKASGSCTIPFTLALCSGRRPARGVTSGRRLSTRWAPVQGTGPGGIAYNPEASYRGLACATARVRAWVRVRVRVRLTLTRSVTPTLAVT